MKLFQISMILVAVSLIGACAQTSGNNSDATQSTTINTTIDYDKNKPN